VHQNVTVGGKIIKKDNDYLDHQQRQAYLEKF
jgi:hypothetical protein